jgi:hypothetical protein
MTTLTDADLEARLRATYRSVTATTVATPRPLEVRERPAFRPLRLSLALASVLLLVALGVVVARRNDEAVGRADGPRWALVSVFEWGLRAVRPYDATEDGLGAQRGDVVVYARGDATVTVMSLRSATIDDDRLVEDLLPGAPSVLTTPDGRLAVRRIADDLTLALRYDGDTDAEHVPDLTYLARAAVTIGADAWARAQQRQGFATVVGDDREPAMEFRLADDLVVTREVTGSLRAGMVAAYRSGIGTWGGTPTMDDLVDVVVYATAAGEPFIVRASPTVVSVTIDSAGVELHPIVDPDSGVAVRWARVELPPGDHEVVGRDAAGAVVVRTSSVVGSPVVEEAP